MTDIAEAISFIENVEKYLYSQGETWYADYLSDAINLLKEQERNPVIVCPHCGKRVK